MSESLIKEPLALESLVGQVADEFLRRQEQGERPEVEEYAARYPEAAAVLRKVLASLLVLDRSMAGLSPAADEASEDRVAGTLGDFRILREIGRGGMGIVYEAEQISLNRRVALKVLPFAATMDPRHLQRFKNEAQAAAALHHTNIVPVHYVGCERGVHFFAMQLIDGQTLAAVIHQLREPKGPNLAGGHALAKAGPEEPTGPYSPAPAAGRPDQCPGASEASTVEMVAALTTEGPAQSPAYFREVARLGIQAAEALEHAHQLGVVHRDVKPGNLMLDGRGNLWVTDFGLARLPNDSGLTMTGDLIGTLGYMSPEQALAKRVVIDHRTDVYSLGATLYELLALRPVFDGNDRQELLRQIAFEEPRALRRWNKLIPAELETIVLKGLEKNPAERYATAQELADDLRRFLEDRPIRARRPRLFQRLRKWGRRRRGVVRTAIASFLVLVLLAVVGLAADDARVRREKENTDRAKKQAEDNERRAKNNEQLANQRKVLAQQQRDAARRSAYIATLLQAQDAWQAGDIPRVLKLLDSQRPQQGLEDLRGWEWYHLLARCHDDLFTLAEGPPEPCVLQWYLGPNIVTSPDGRRVAWFGPETVVRVWDLTTKQRVLVLRGHKQRVAAVAWSPNGKRLATGGYDCTVKLWDAASEREVSTFPRQPRPIVSLAWSPDSKRLATGGFNNGTIKIWDADAAKELDSWTDPQRSMLTIDKLAWTPDGRSLAAARGVFNGLLVWDVAGKQKPRVLGGQKDPASSGPGSSSLAWGPGGKLIALQNGRGEVQIWDVTAGRKLRTFSNYNTFDWHPKRPWVATDSPENIITVRDVTNGNEVLTLRGHSAEITSLAWADEGRLVSASVDLAIKVWDASGSKDTFVLGPGSHVGLPSPDGRRIVQFPANASEQAVEVWDLTRGKKLFTAPAIRFANTVSWAPDGQRLAIQEKKGTAIWDLVSGRVSVLLPTAGGATQGSRYGGFNLAWSADGRRLATVSHLGVRVWDPATGKEIPHLRIALTRAQSLSCAALSPDGRRLACSGSPGVIRIWDVQTGKEGLPLPGHAAGTHSLTWSPDGKWLLSNGEDPQGAPMPKQGGGKVWDVARREELFHLPGAILGAWSPDSRRFCSFVGDRSPSRVVIWDSATFREVSVLPGASSLPTWLPAGRRLLTTGYDWQAHTTRVHFWDASAGYARAEEPLVPADLTATANRSLTLLQLGGVLRDNGRFAEAERAYRQALGIQGEVIARAPRALEHRQTLGRLYFELARLLREAGRTEEALAAFRQALKIQELVKKERKQAHMGFEEADRTHDELGRLLELSGRLEEAKHHYAQAGNAGVYAEARRRNRTVWTLAHSPEPEVKDSLEVYVLRANSSKLDLQRAPEPPGSEPEIWVTTDRWKFRYAAPTYRQLLEKNPLIITGRVMIRGPARDQRGLREGDELFFFRPVQPSIRLMAVGLAGQNRKWIADQKADLQCQADVLATLGMACYRAGLWKDAINVLVQSRRLRKGDEPVACLFQAMSHWQLGQKQEARKWHERARRQMEKTPPRDGEVLGLAREAEGLLLRNQQPRDAAQGLALAQDCQQRCRDYRAAAGFYREAFLIKPALAAPPRVHRYNAACAAALAAARQGKDATQLDDKECARLRQQALAWLQADLAAWTKLVEKAPAKVGPVLQGTMKHWQQDTDLAGLREPAAQAKLPEAERDAWNKLWAAVEELRKRAAGRK
jgi:WD40 repeat protein/serine/threonine protein kinase/tetratricopeptide (TPR) repeat protein